MTDPLGISGPTSPTWPNHPNSIGDKRRNSSLIEESSNAKKQAVLNYM